MTGVQTCALPIYILKVLKADTKTIKSDNLVMGIKTLLDITFIAL